MKKLTNEQFIEKAKNVHGNKYDYSKVDYKGNDIKVCIICPIHGEFWQTPRNHIKGSECPKCVGKYRYTTEEWIEEAKKVHGDKYDYSNVIYKGAFEKVCIICKEHGEFWPQPSNHLRGIRCPLCGLEVKRAKRTLPAEDIFISAKAVHGV